VGEYRSVVIMARTVKGSGIVTASESVNSVFTRLPSREWVSAAGGKPDAALEAQLLQAYRKSDAAFKALDWATLKSLAADEFTHTLANRTQRTLEQELAALRANVKSIDSVTTLVVSFFKRKDRVFVVTLQQTVGAFADDKRAIHKVKDTTNAADIWIMKGKELRITRSVDLREQANPVP
jgi:hypothetical protein